MSEAEYCDKCNGSGTIVCHCGGDMCACGLDYYDCPYCDTQPEPMQEDETGATQ